MQTSTRPPSKGKAGIRLKIAITKLACKNTHSHSYGLYSTKGKKHSTISALHSGPAIAISAIFQGLQDSISETPPNGISSILKVFTFKNFPVNTCASSCKSSASTVAARALQNPKASAGKNIKINKGLICQKTRPVCISFILFDPQIFLRVLRRITGQYLETQ